jgi:hypothetical protein
MIKVNFKKYFLYLVRWQLSTPILAPVISYLGVRGVSNFWISATIANLIGGLIFFWVDLFIFTSRSLAAQWEVKENIECSDCGNISRGYRLVKSENYDHTKDKKPKFRCESCSKKKAEKLKSEGIKVE